MSNEIWIALIGVGSLALGYLINGLLSNKNLKDTAENQKQMLILTLQNQKELALIAANQYNLVESHKEQIKVVEEYHKEVNGKMTKLLETTEALGKEKGKAEEKASPTAEGAGKIEAKITQVGEQVGVKVEQAGEKISDKLEQIIKDTK